MRPHDRARRKVVELPETFAVGFWEDQDGRSIVVREIKRRVAQLSAHVGVDSEQRRILVQRAVFLDVQLESMECAAIESRQLEHGVYTSLTNALVGILRTLGIDKRAFKAGGLKEYVNTFKDDE